MRFRTCDDGDEGVEEDELEGDVPDQAKEHVSLLTRHVHDVAPEHLCICVYLLAQISRVFFGMRLFTTRQVDIRLPGKGNSDPHGATQVLSNHLDD